MPSLYELGKQHQTDKAGHGYLVHYEKRFQQWRQEPIKLLEIGIWNGASLRMWRDYFPQATIYGIDIQQEAVDKVAGEPKIWAFCGSQDNAEFLDHTVREFAPLDIVIDDGSHRGTHHVISFEALWPHLKYGGWYCIEDCQSIFNVCWTQPGERTMVNVLTERISPILRGQDEIREVALVGEWIYSGMIFMRKEVIRPEKPLGT